MKTFLTAYLKFGITFVILSGILTGLFAYVNGIDATLWDGFVKTIYTLLIIVSIVCAAMDYVSHAERSNP